MSGFYKWFILNYLPILVALLLFFFWKFFSSNHSNKQDYNNPSKNWDTVLGPNVKILRFILFVQLILLLTAKASKESELIFNNFFVWNVNLFYICFIFFTLICLYIIKKNKTDMMEAEVIMAACVWFLIILLSLFLVDNFLSFLLLLELSAVVYLFFILVFLKNKDFTVIKLKNFISTYLWVSFITLIFFFVGLLLVVKFNGTITFQELWCLDGTTPAFVWQFLFVAILWKIGSPGFYFFKLELYQYLPVTSLIFFSIVSAFMGFCFLHFFFINCWPIFVNQNLFLISYIVVYNILMLTRGLKSLSFFQFLAFSSANTWSVLLLFYLI